jgi:hypothetical protein
MTNYTFTFPQDGERRFRDILSRLDPDEFVILEEMSFVKPEEPRYSDKQIKISMEEEAALTFRMGMGNNVKIRRERTEEELAEEQAIIDQHVVKIHVKVPGTITPPSTGTTP